MPPSPTHLNDLVDISQRVGEDASRRAKIAHIAGFLRGLAPNEIEIGVSYLAGVTRQGRSGIGYALIRDARPTANASTSAITLTDVDVTLERIAATVGPGSAKERLRLLGDLFARATAREQDFLARLLLGELRQGALEGLMIEAVAIAANVPVNALRRAAMVAGGITLVAASALNEGEAGLHRY